MLKTFNYNSSSLFYSTIFGLFILNLILKISYLDSEPFWYDESISVKTTFSDFGHIKHEADWDNNPPFYYYCIWVWVKLFGISEFKVRFLSVLFSACSAVLLFTFSKKYFNYLTAVSAALMFSFHNFLYEYTHEARSYSLIVLLVILSAILFLKFLEKPNFLNIFFLGLVNFLIAYTHYLAVLAIFLQLIFLLIYYRPKFKYFFITLIITAGLVLLRFTKKQFLTIFSFDKEGKSFWLKKADLELFNETLQNILLGKEIYLVMSFILICSVIFIFIKKNYESPVQKNILVYSFFIGVLSVICLFLLGKVTPVFHSRYLLFATPFVLLLLSWFLTTLNKWSGLLIPLILSFQLLFIKLNPQKPMDYRLASMVVKKIIEKDPAMILLQTKDITGLFTYYFDRNIYLDHKHLKENINKVNIFDIQTSEDLNSINFLDNKTIVFCQTFENDGDSKQVFERFKANGFVYSTSTFVKGVKISLLKKIKN